MYPYYATGGVEITGQALHLGPTAYQAHGGPPAGGGYGENFARTPTPPQHHVAVHLGHPAAPAHPAARHLVPVHLGVPHAAAPQYAPPPQHAYAPQPYAPAYGGAPSYAVHPQLAAPQPPGVHPTVHPGGSLAYGGAPRVVERPLRDMREFPLGFFQSGIGVGVGTIEVISRPQIVFRGERLVIPTTVAPFFSLIDIKIGNRSQLVNSTALPAQVFTETAVGIRLSLDTATVAQDISLAVQNIDPVTAHTFQAALIGTAAQ